MSIVAEYTNDVISAAGCGGAEGGGFMHFNAGASASGAGADDSVFIMYRLPLDYPAGDDPILTPNEPRPVIFYEEKRLDLPVAEFASRRDAHGVTMSPSRRFLYQFDRIQNKAEVFDMAKVAVAPGSVVDDSSAAHVGTIDLTGSGFCVGEGEPYVDQDDAAYEFDDDPAPDLVDISPDGRRIVVSFRGPNPVTVKHAARGSCPGFGVVTLDRDGASGSLTHVFRTFVRDWSRTRNLSDIHAAIVRIKGPNVPKLCLSWQGCLNQSNDETEIVR